MAIQDFFSNVKNKVQEFIPKVQVFRQKARDFITGEDDEYRRLRETYEVPFERRANDLITQYKSGQLAEQDLNQRYQELTKEQKQFELTPEGQKYKQKKQEIMTNYGMNLMGGGVQTKITGKAKKIVFGIAQSKKAEEIVTLIKKFNITDEIAQKISKNLVDVTDEQSIYKVIKSGQVISKVEKKIGATVDKEIKNKISQAVDHIYQNTFDPDTEKLAINKITDDVVAGYKKRFEKLSKETSDSIKKEGNDLLIKLEDRRDTIHKMGIEDSAKADELMEKLKKGELKPDEKLDAFELLKRADTKLGVAKEERSIIEATKNRAAREARDKELNKEQLGRELKESLDRGDLEPKSSLKGSLKNQGKEEALGVVAGVEQDEEGKLSFNPAKAAAGVGAMGGIKAVKSNIRKATGQFKRTPFRTTEEKALREKLRTASIYSKIGKRGFIKTTKDLRKAVREYAKDLPVIDRRRILSTESFAKVKSKKELTRLLDKVDMARKTVAIKKEKRTLKIEIGHLRKIARDKDVIGKVKMQVRKELGIKNEQAVKNASLSSLKRYKEIVKENLKSAPPTPKEVDWKNIPDVGSSKGITTRKKIAQGIESGLGTISSNIRKYGGPDLFSLVREREFQINVLSKRATDKIEGFQKGITKLQKKWFGGKEAYRELSYSLFNQNFDRAREIATKYKFGGELEKVIEVLDDIHLRANEAGLKVGKLKNYFPRMVKDYDGLFAAYNKKFGKEGRSFLDSLLTKEANKKSLKVSELTQEMKSDILTKALRGYGQGKINVGNVTRARKLKDLDPEFLQYYHTPQDALTQYVSNMNQRITLKKLFDIGDVERDTIGSMVEKRDITPNEMARLKESLYAVLAPQGGENVLLNKLRKSATLTLLSNISSTLFQIADIGLNAYKHGVGRAILSLIRNKPIKRDELFTSIAHEFADSKFITRTLKAVGFDRLDRLNSEAFMANAFRQATRQAKKGSKEIKEYANVVFRGKEERIAKFMDDIKAGKVTDDTRLYVFNKILDVNPRTMTEMPEAYAKYPNARLFYSMKSYGLKVLDVYRNDVARQWKKSPLKSAKNFVMLTGILTMAGATGSQIRDWYNGKDTKFSDNVINNMLQIMMFSTYDTANLQRDGLGKTLLTKALPPSRWLDDLSKDVLTAGDGEGLKSIRNIPVIGTEIYNRAGKGKDAIEDAKSTSKAQYNQISEMTPQDQRVALAKLKKTSPNKYTRVKKEMKWEKLGVTDKERKLSSMGVEDGERAEAIAKYLKKQKNWQVTYKRLRQAGIITPEVLKQLKPLMK